MIATTTFSGCLAEDWLKTRPSPITLENAGLVRYFLAVTPGGLPEDFVDYTITLGPIDVMFDLLGEVQETIAPGGQEVDLLFLERNKKAFLMAERYVPEGEWEGFEFGVSEAELTRNNVIGNRGGEAIYDRETLSVRVPVPPGKSEQRSLVLAKHGSAPGHVVDVYVEIDVRRSLQAQGRDIFEHRSQVNSASLYIDGAKKGQKFYGLDVANARANLHSVRGGPPPTSALMPPEARIKLEDAWGDLQRPNVHRVLPRALGLGVPYRFDGSGSISLMMNQDNDLLPIVEHQWDFGDGTEARGATVWKTYETGGVYDVELRVRDGLDSYASTFMTVFVPYTAAEATDVREEVRTGSLVGVDVQTEAASSRHHHALSFPEDLTDGVWNHGGYRLTVEFDDPLGLVEDDDLTLMRMNATSDYIKRSVEGVSPLVIETAGIPVWRGGVVRDWVVPEIDIELTLLRGVTVDYSLKVEALYYGNLSRGIDSHGNHIHGSWPLLQPYFDHLTSKGTAIRPYPEGFDPDDPEGDGEA